MIIDNKFDIGQEVYIKTDVDQIKGIINSIEVCPNELLIYKVAIRSFTHGYYDFEISAEKDIITATSN